MLRRCKDYVGKSHDFDVIEHFVKSKSKHVIDQESSTPHYIFCPVKKVSTRSGGVRTKESFRVRAHCLFIITRTILDAKLNPFIKEKKNDFGKSPLHVIRRLESCIFVYFVLC